MKKFLSIIAALFCISGSLCSCNQAEPITSEPVTPGSPKRVSTLPIDENILGTWMNDQDGYEFGDDRKMSLIINFSDRGHFTSDGAFQTLGGLVSKDNVNYDGSRLYVTETFYEEDFSEDVASILIDMERTDGEDPDSINGEYKVFGGIIAELIAEELGIDTPQLNFKAKVEDETLLIIVDDCFDYETRAGKVDIFSDNLIYVDESANSLTYSYEINGDTLTMTFEGVENSEPETYKKITD